MADYKAILRKTIDGLEDRGADVRNRVYEKARASILRKIDAMETAPPQAVIDRQMGILQTAIDDVEADYLALDAIDAASDFDAPILFDEDDEAKPLDGHVDIPAAATVSAPVPQPGGLGTKTTKADDAMVVNRSDARVVTSHSENRNRRGTVASTGIAFLVLLLAGAAGYAAWLNKDDLGALIAKYTGDQTVDVAVQGEGESSPEEAVVEQPVVDKPVEEAAPEPEPAPEVAVVEPAPVPAVEAAPEKLTQRLLPDGSEVDPGAGGEGASVVEGTSVANVTPPVEGAVPAAPVAAVPVGQKAIFYEERTTAEEGSALAGAVVWSVVQESPGNDLPPEPAIQGAITIPELALNLRMTIRRNADTTLPASHIIEMLFTTPEDFKGGAIDQVQRVTLKSTEQATGTPLVALPAKIAEGFFLVALNNAPTALEANQTLLRREAWIDIPVVYRTGRRGLITMEKGIPGDKAFDEALQAWAGKSAQPG
jgi:hypothetical protein